MQKESNYETLRALRGYMGRGPRPTGRYADGGYPLVASCNGAVYCPECLGRADVWPHVVRLRLLAGVDIHWEGPPESCDVCGDEIESAYGDSKSVDNGV